MNFKLTKSNTKGKEETTITISPSDSLEREFFNQLFSNGNIVEFTKLPNSEDVIISKRGDFLSQPADAEKINLDIKE